MTRSLDRLLRPRSVAVIGGGAWCRSVLEQLARFGDEITVWHVHPRDENSLYKTVSDLPEAPDAAFVGINRDATIEAVSTLSAAGAGGAVCFASGFAEVSDGHERNSALLAAAGEMPILGPNCYGYINALDGALLWPDQHGCRPVDRGVAILTQSSNISINMTMQTRGLPIAYMLTCGNQAQTSQAEIAMSLLDDPRVTAIGLHIEGFGDIGHWQELARKAAARAIPLVAIKVGRSQAAREATVSHTASLAGSDAGAQALLDRFGIARADDIPTFLETLKLYHVTGPLPSNRIASISCSGGEASLAADSSVGLDLTFPPLNQRQQKDLFGALGERVALANPLDYHTYIWRDVEAMTQAFSAMLDPDLALTLLIVDFPNADRCDPSDWDCAIQAALRAKAEKGGNVAMVATLPECMPEAVAETLLRGGVIPFHGLREALHAASAATKRPLPDLAIDLVNPDVLGSYDLLTEAEAKTDLQAFGVIAPKAALFDDPADARTACAKLCAPFVLKGQGFAHKSENDAIRLGLETGDAVEEAARTITADSFLVEEMVTGSVAEILVGVVHDPAHGFVLTLGAGGIMTEVMRDTVQLMIPATRQSVSEKILQLRCAALLRGFRGKEPAHLESILDNVMAVQDYVMANSSVISEIEINPLICTPTRAVAADALIRKKNAK